MSLLQFSFDLYFFLSPQILELKLAPLWALRDPNVSFVLTAHDQLKYEWKGL